MAKRRTRDWQSRIVKQAEVDPTTLVPNPGNWRIHPRHQARALGQVLDKVGWVGNVTVNETTGHVVDGHLRLQLALDRNEPKVPTSWIKVTEEEEKLILATLDPIAELAGTDAALLEELREAVTIDGDLAGVVEDVLDRESELMRKLPTATGGGGEGDGNGKVEDSAKDFWPVLRLQVPPDAFQRFRSLTAEVEGDDAERFLWLLDQAAT